MILCIETATNICSVALCNTDGIAALRESSEEKSHASMLSLFIIDLLAENRLKAADLEAVAVSMGPGSYTGLRIGVSVAKGIAYASKIPLVAINTLESMFHGMIGISPENDSDLFCPAIDARRMEIYSALFYRDGRLARETASEVIDENSYASMLQDNKILFFGTGAKKCSEAIRHPNARFNHEMVISAASMHLPARTAVREKNYADVAYFEPYYLKDFIATIPRKNLLKG